MKQALDILKSLLPPTDYVVPVSVRKKIQEAVDLLEPKCVVHRCVPVHFEDGSLGSSIEYECTNCGKRITKKQL